MPDNESVVFKDRMLRWTVHTPNLLKEIVECGGPSMDIMNKPLNIFRIILLNVATRASQLNDPIMNDLMCQLTLYDVADPTSKDYDFETIKEVCRLAAETSMKEQGLDHLVPQLNRGNPS